MSVRPGTQIIQRETPPPRSAPTDTGVWLVVGMCDRGSITKPVTIESLAEFNTQLGGRVTYSVLYDALDTFFHEGGGTAIVSRVVGPAAASSHLNLLDASSGVSLVVTANSPGLWGNNVKVAVIAPVTMVAPAFRLQMTDLNNNILETSPDLGTQQNAVDWANNQSAYVTIVLGASVNPPQVAAGQAMAGGTDDRSNATDADWQKALDRLIRDYGPGQVSMPGRTTDAAHTALLAHAQALNRSALLDLPDSGNDATLRASVATARAGGNARFGAAFAPWVVVPGVVPGTTRTVPPSGYVAGGIARTDALYNSNTPAAGENGQALWAIDLSQPGWTDAIRTNMNLAGVDVIRMLYGGVRTYGWRTIVDPVADPNWIDFGNSRLFMSIAAEADVIAEDYVLKPIDGQGVLIASFGGDLTAMLMGYYNEGALYGVVPNEAFRVDVGPQVNTPETISNQELHAVISMRMSPFAELVVLEVVKVGITEAV